MLKKVLFVCSLYRPNIGGIERFIEEFSIFLKMKNIHVAVLTKRYPGNLLEYETINDVDIVRVKRPITLNDHIETANVIQKYENILQSDIIHVVGIRRPLPLYAALLSKKWQVPYLTTFSGADTPSPSYTSAWNDWLESRDEIEPAVLGADWKVAFSKDLIKNAKHCMNELSEVDVIYAGMDLDRLKSAPKFSTDASYILCAARLIYAKGIDILIQSFAEVLKSFPNYKLFVIGDGPERESLEALTLSLSLLDSVVFLGEKTLDDVYSYIKGAKCVVVPSREEGGGTINIEIQGCGTYVIASDAGGIPEYVLSPHGGCLFKAGDVRDLAYKLIDFLCGVGSSDLNSIEIKRFVEKFSWDNVGNQYLNGYNSLIAKHRPGKIKPWNEVSDVLANFWSIKE